MSETARWPRVSFEQHQWQSRDHIPASRQAQRRARQPYEAVVVPAIAHVDIALPSSVLAAAEDASNEIARFDAEVGAEIAPFSSILLRSESAASSRIENLTASARAIAEAELGHGSRNASLIVANERAMVAAIALADRLDAPAILDMHSALLNNNTTGASGKWRDQQVWIGGGHFSPHDAAFVPPHHSRIPSAIDDLVEFISRADIPALAHAAITHAQFETIHPFTDGNGRVGRAFVHAQLRHASLTRFVTVPVSAGLLADVNSYFAALGEYREGNPVPIVERFADATFGALANGRQLVTELRSTRNNWIEQVSSRRDSATWKVLEIVVRQPVVSAGLLSRELGIPQSNVYRALQPLVNAGVLAEFTNKKRHRLWRAPEILDSLDAFAARAGRRQRPAKSGEPS